MIASNLLTFCSIVFAVGGCTRAPRTSASLVRTMRSLIAFAWSQLLDLTISVYGPASKATDATPYQKLAVTRICCRRPTVEQDERGAGTQAGVGRAERLGDIRPRRIELVGERVAVRAQRDRVRLGRRVRRVVYRPVNDRFGDEQGGLKPVGIRRKRLLVRPHRRVALTLQIERRAERLPERCGLGKVPRRRAGEEQ